MQVLVDGARQSAVASKVSLPPFISFRDGSLDAVSLGKLAGFIRRGAYKSGWLKGLNPTFREQLDQDEKPTQSVFMVGQLVVLDRLCRYNWLPLNAECGGTCTLTNCGRSSYTVACAVDAPAVSDVSGPLTHAGYAVHSFVTIDLATRRPAQINEGARQEAAVALDALAQDPEGSKLKDKATLSRLAPAMRPGGETPHFRFSSRVRPYSDFDFNGHLNQGVYVSLALDGMLAFGVYAKEEQDASTSWLRDFVSGVNVHVRGIRVDYLKEVADPQAALTVELWDARGSTAVNEQAFVQELARIGTDAGDSSCPIWFEVSSSSPSAGEALNAIGILVVNGPERSTA